MRIVAGQFRVSLATRLFVFAAVVWAASPFGGSAAWAQFIDATAVTAEIRARQSIALVGNPIWVDFTLHNPTDQLSVLYLGGAHSLELNAPEMGLPLEHVLDRGEGKAIVVMDQGGREIGFGTGAAKPGKSIAVRLAPQSSVGLRIDVSLYCPTLKQPGKYRLQWRPYQGAIQSNVIDIQIGALKQARIETDSGPMTIRFFYEDAPMLERGEFVPRDSPVRA